MESVAALVSSDVHGAGIVVAEYSLCCDGVVVASVVGSYVTYVVVLVVVSNAASVVVSARVDGRSISNNRSSNAGSCRPAFLENVIM